MFQKIAKFFIENSKLTLILVIVVLISWIWSYIMLPKQYNPTIIVPAFNVFVEANWLWVNQVSNLIISPLENKIMELEWVDEVYWIAEDNYWSVMVKFHVWIDKEKAKIRLNQKLSENNYLKPLWVSNPIITTIDPDELSQIVFWISYIDKNSNLSDQEIYSYLKQIANILKQNFKTIENTTTLNIVWWLKKNIIINFDLKKIEANDINILYIYDLLKTNNYNSSLWNIYLNNLEKISLDLKWKLNEINDLKKIIIKKSDDKIIYLEDIAKINYWVDRIKTSSLISDENWTYKTVFLWVWKAIWTNWVFVTKQIVNKLNEIKKTLPKDVKITNIFDEWIKAKNATNMLIINLFQSILIVIVVLAFYLWIKNALNTAISIPLTLWMVFVLALIFWENINRITLFALILVLWMLVDDSTVVVENINRHLNERIKTWKSKLDAILIAIKEVELWVILSTVTRLLAFWAMFAVWWMMWEYMWPIPKFALMASIISTSVALTINPWISFNLSKDVDLSKQSNSLNKESKLKIRKKYLSIMKYFLWNENKFIKRRKIFKIWFWLLLFLVILWPIYLWIFKARMLPKSNQDQIYIWIDAPRWWWIDKTKQVEEYMQDLLLNKNNTKVNSELKNTINFVSSTIWQAYIWEFANLFRGWLSRIWENQISARLNLLSQDEYKNKYNKNRLKSEEFTIKLRNWLKRELLKKYPDIKISLLEDPPWPPVKSTFLLKIKWNASLENKQKFLSKVQNEINNISQKKSLEDLNNSNSTTYKKINLVLDNQSFYNAWLTLSEVQNYFNLVLNWLNINLINDNNTLESTNIILSWNNWQTIDLNFLNSIHFLNKNWLQIPLSSIAKIDYSFVWNTIFTDKREETIYINWEMWNNSLVYPVLNLIKIFKSKEFLSNELIIKSFSPYKIEYIWVNDEKSYILEWWWEWELTLDTFRDLWIAMFISLLAIYFLLVAQFSSFWIAWIIMVTFLLWFFWVFPWFSFLYLLNWEYFSATSMIWIIALAWIVVWNAILLIEYVNILKNNWLTIKDALLKAWYVRFTPIILTSMTTVFWAATIIWDPVWSWLAWTIIWWLLVSSILTLIVIPIFYYDSQKKYWK